MSPTVELVLDCGCDLGEGPIWDSRTQTLYFVDINRSSIHTYVPSTKLHNVIKLDEPVGAVALTSDPSILLAATRSSISTVNLKPQPGADHVGTLLASVPPSHGTEGAYRFNDGKVAPRTGCFIVGRMHSDWRRGQRGRLYCLEPASSGNLNKPQLKEILETVDIGLPNGLAWSDDGGTCFFVDSAAETVTAYDVDASGAPTIDHGAPRVVSHIDSQHSHVPDGMTIDSNGNLWVVYGESGAVTCIDINGKELHRIHLPIKRPTSCCFGGPNFEDLYVTTRIEAGSEASPNHGGLFKVSIPGVTGVQGALSYFPLS